MCFIIIVQNVEQTFNQINNMKNLKLFSVILMLLVGIGQVWATDYELMLTLDLASHAATGTTSTGLTNTTLLTFLQTAAPATTDITAASLTGNVYNGKGSGGGDCPQQSLKIGKASGGGSITFTIASSYDDVTKVEITGRGWKTTTAISVNSSDAQYPAVAQSQEYTFPYEISATKTITIDVATSALCATEIKLYKTKNGGGSDPVAVTGVSLNKASTSIVEGKTETLVATVAPSNASDKSVSWSSDDESVATVDGGIVTAVAAGTATITVTTTDGSFTDECEVTVTEAPAAVNYELVTNVSELADAAEIIIVNIDEDKALSITQQTNNRAATDVLSTSSVIAAGDDVQVITLEASSSNWKFNVGDSKYLYAASSSANQLKSAAVATSGENGVWSIAIADDGAATILAQGSNTRNFLRYNPNSGSPIFNCYASNSTTGTLVKIFKKVDGTVLPSAELAYAASSVEKLVGAEAFTNELTNPHTVTVSYASDNTGVATVDPATGAVSIVAAGKAVITASFAGNDDYKAGSASYTIVVTEHAGTEADPYSVADAKIVIDAVGTKENAYVSGIVSSIYSTSLEAGGAISFYISADGATSGQQLEAYKCLSLNSEAFTALSDVKTGATVVITGTLKKFSSTYEFDQNCHLVSYVAPVAPKQHIANDQANPYTVAQALVYAADGVTYDLDDYVYVRGVVYDVKSFNNGAMNIFIKDADAENSFELFKCAGINDGSATTPFEALTDVQVGDIVIGYGQLTVFNTVYEFKQGNYLVDLDRPAVAVTGIDLTESTAEVEVGSTVTLHASVVPGNATDQGIVWSVTSGSDKASVDENGVVTGVAEGTAVIRAASHEDASIYEECTVTVTAVDPTKHTVTFDATIDISDQETSITKSGITITASKFNNNEEGKYYYQCYASSAMTVSSTVGNITNIELTCTASGTAKYGPGNWDFTGYSYSGANGSWTGSAETVEFGNASQQVRMTLITVTYKEDNREAAGLVWNPADDIEITVGDAFSAPALLNPNSIDAAEITIESSNTSLATVTAGVVSLVADATGTATITATFAGNDDYKPATISYNITVNEAGLDNVTFDSSEDLAESGETTITKGGFTLSFTSGSMDGTQAEYRLYKSQTMTLSSTDYLIKKIEFTCTSGNPITGFADATGLDKDNNEWTGESNTVELTASNAQVRMTKIKVFYVEDTRAAAGLTWSTNEVEIMLGDEFTAATLQNPNNIAAGEITIASDNTELATVSAGVVSLVEDAVGTAHITATFAGNETYKPATISYTIIVNDPTPTIYVDKLNVNFGTVATGASVGDQTITVMLTNVATATATLGGTNPEAFSISPAALTASGGITISFVGSTAEVASFAATITITDDAGVATQKVVNLSLTVDNVETAVSTSSKWIPATAITDGMIVLITGVKDDVTYAMGTQTNNNRTAVAGTLSAGVFTPGASTMPFTVVAQDDGTYALRTSAGQYLYAASSSGNHLKTQSQLNADAKWTLSTTSAVAEGSSNRNVMQFNGSSKLFACYSSASQSPIALYVKQPKVIDNDATETAVETGDNVTVKDGGVLTINNAKQVGDVVVEAGGTVSASSYQLTVKDFTINTQSGKSGQVLGTNVNVTGNLYLEIKLRDGDMDAEASRLWYCISAPFDVNMNGGFFWGDGTPMVLNTHFQLFEYDGQKRANTGNGWKRVNGTMKANTAYFIGFDDAQGNQNTIKLKANAKTIPAVAPIALNEYFAADAANANWNAVANPTLRYVGLDKTVQVFDPEHQNYNPFPYFGAAYAFVVGTPFFYKGTGSIVLNTDPDPQVQYRAPQHRAESYNYCVQISKAETERFDNQLYVVASETAAATYEEGQDVPSMNEETSKYGALIWTENYGDKRLAIEEAPLVNSSASYVLGIYAPEDGEYTISTPQAKEDVSLYLTREGRVIWDLTAAPYTLDLTKGNTTGYGLRIVAAPKATTDLEDVQGDKVQCTKVLINNHVFILRGEQLYDATGRLVK